MESTLGKRIIQYRKRLGLTQDQLAEKLGLTAQAVSKWENDQSCPDISILPKLADIFGITTDELLGHETAKAVCETQVLPENDSKDNGFTYDNGKMDFHWDGIKLEGIGLACWVLLTGLLYLAVQFLPVELNLWDILWPSFLLVFGLFGIYPKFSAFRLGCALVGGCFLLDKMELVCIKMDKGILFAAFILLFGLSLLAEALRKNKHPRFTASYTDKNGKVHHGKMKKNYTTDGNRFFFESAFGENTQIVQLEKLKYGEISTNFGEYTVDLSGIGALESGCTLEASCNFGELTILVPRHFSVQPDSSTSFASFELEGIPDSAPRGIIHLNASASFGTICVRYQ